MGSETSDLRTRASVRLTSANDAHTLQDKPTEGGWPRRTDDMAKSSMQLSALQSTVAATKEYCTVLRSQKLTINDSCKLQLQMKSARTPMNAKTATCLKLRNMTTKAQATHVNASAHEDLRVKRNCGEKHKIQNDEQQQQSQKDRLAATASIRSDQEISCRGERTCTGQRRPQLLESK